MKKYFTILVLSTFLIPSVAFASWWNPLTWFSSSPTPNATDEEITLLEQKITNLQNEINASTSISVIASSSVSATSTASTTPVVKKIVIKKTPPATPPAPANNVVSAPSSSNSAAAVQACINTVNQTSAAELSQISNDEQQAYTTYQNDVAELTAGTYPLTAAQQAQVNALNAEDATALYSAQLQDGATSNENNPEGSKIQETIANHNSQAALTNLGNEFAATNYQIVNDQYNAYTATENEKEANVTALAEAALASCSNGN